MTHRPPAKPHLRGWLHVATVPVALAYGIALVLLARDADARVSVLVFAGAATGLFAVSATLHRGHWGPRAHGLLQRLDHSAIFVLIAASYTPFTVLLLPPGSARTLLALVWGGALIGSVFRVAWLRAPRWLYTPAYIALGWAAVAFLPDFLAAHHPWVLVMALLGGLLYTAGGIVYAVRRPDPWPRWFGFHEVFHSLTVAGFASHCVGVGLAVAATS